ncbi:metallopeptidase family protein [uncultured Jatrophihabitans sp.]|uniref:metallopeptidase family protein n=1 Tax=uncultured Jatrophihabitans sp. TaxID=1610747 RepID=UPI0035CB81B9
MVEVSRARFEQLVADALDSLPADFRRLISNVQVVVEPGDDPHLLGLYQGVPLTERTSDYSAVLPDKITIFQDAICARAGGEQEVVDEVRTTVVHEVGHHFGIDDDRLHELGW